MSLSLFHEHTSRDVAEVERFDLWWALYPRKVAKIAARRAWNAAIRRITAETGCSRRQAEDQLITALRHFTFNPDQRFQPHPATWLNSGRYLDESAEQSTIQASVMRAVGLS